jgi:adenylate cyclase
MADTRTRADDTGDAAGSKPSAAEVRAALERILASRFFQQAGRASDFLRFVVERTLEDGGQRLKGYTIGVEVFGRPADFDAQSDALVRVEAGRLRRRLIDYYANDGAADPIRIELPRGNYAVDYRFAAARVEEPVAAPAPAPEPQAAAAPRSFSWRSVAVTLGLLLVAATGVIAWQVAELQQARALASLAEPPRTEWPRIVVVPFENLSSDDALDAIAASMTEEIMLRLDDLDLFVVATQSSWYGPNDKTNLEAAAGGYVLTGSVRGTGDQARITARLIEAESGAQLWTAVYDEPLLLHGLPVLQDRVAHDVVAIAAPYGPIFEAELQRARRSRDEPKLRDCLAAYHEYRRRVTPAWYEETLACLQSVSKRQADFAPVWAGLAMLYVDEFSSSFGRTGPQALVAAREATERALALDPDDFSANLALTRVRFFDGDPQFRDGIERAIRLRPNSAQALGQGGFLLVITGDARTGIELAEKARAQTKAPQGFYHLTYAANYLGERRFDEAFAAAEKVDGPNWVFAQALLAAAAAHSGRLDAAHGAVQRIRELYPAFEADSLNNFEHWRFSPALHEALVSGLRAAGLELGVAGKAADGG